jgi:hypothetical protein
MKVIPSIDDHLSALSIQLAAQPPWKMSCFNAACAERLVPWYVSECAITGACPDTLREIVDSIWQSIVDEQVEIEAVADRKAILDVIEFDEDLSRSPGTVHSRLKRPPLTPWMPCARPLLSCVSEAPNTSSKVSIQS